MNHNKQGFSLLETLCVCWIVAILSLIAYPSYQYLIGNSLLKDAQAAMLHKASALWQQHIDQSESILDLAREQTWPQFVANHNYQLNIETDNTGQLIIVAKAIGKQKKRDHCSPWILSESMQLFSNCRT